MNLLDNVADSVTFYSLTIDKFFDPLDAVYLQHLLDQKTEAIGYQSEFRMPGDSKDLFPGREGARQGEPDSCN
ncbi:MAG: hypothetical protein MZV63_54010 [Marinilabiliales bacterium]|nr:hypothetical protein [Marinilabiliales bacterium]